MLERSDQRNLTAVAGRKDLGVRDRWMIDSLAAKDEVVVAKPPEFYALPDHASKILAPSSLDELQSALALVREANDELAGTRASVAHALLWTDPRVTELRARMRAWAISYVEARLAKSNSRDRADPVRRFMRLLDELVPRLDEITFDPASVHMCFLGELTDYIPWLVFQRTWASWLAPHPIPDEKLMPLLALRVRVPEGVSEREALATLERNREYCAKIIDLYGWSGAYDLERFVRSARVRGSVVAPVEREEALATLSSLAADLLEMRPLLLELNPVKAAIELAPGVLGTWMWSGQQDTLGGLTLYESEREMLEAHHKRMHGSILHVDFDGRLTCGRIPWIDVDSAAELQPDALARNLDALERVHAKLFSFYERIDLRAIRDVARADTASEQDFAAVCQLAAADSPAPSTEAPQAGPRRIPTFRMEPLLALFRDRLGCEVRQGKGSEVVVYRTGGKIVRLGRHKRNREVPSMLIRGALDRLGITFAEWSSAIGSR